MRTDATKIRKFLIGPNEFYLKPESAQMLTARA